MSSRFKKEGPVQNHSDLKQFSDEEILLRLNRLVQSERKIMHLVLLHIQEVDFRKLYLNQGCTSLYQYLTQICGYAENAAYDRIQAVRLLTQHPQISQKIEEGSLKLSQLVKVSSCLKQSKKEGKEIHLETTTLLLQQIQNKTSFETEQILAKEFQLIPQYQQKIKPQQDESIQLQLTMTAEQYALFQKAMSFISHIIPDQNMADGITYLAKQYIQKTEGKLVSEKSKNAQDIAKQSLKEEIKVDLPNQVGQFNEVTEGSKTKSINKIESLNQMKLSNESTSSYESVKSYESIQPRMTQHFLKSPFVKSKRKYISVHIKRNLMQRARHSCEYVFPETKQKCCSKYQLQLDHCKPLALGGTNHPNNLRILCGVHNRSESERILNKS